MTKRRYLRKRHCVNDTDNKLIKNRKIEYYSNTNNQVKLEIKEEIKNEDVKVIDFIKLPSKEPINNDVCDNNLYCIDCDKNDPCKSKHDCPMNSHRMEEFITELPERVECNVCGKSIQRKLLGHHKKIHSRINHVPKPKKEYICTICGKNCINKQRFTKHQRVHSNQKVFSCDQCAETFNFLSHVTKHMAIVHQSVITKTKFICPICQKEVMNLSAHLQGHKDEPVQCDLCGETLKNNAMLMSHKNHHKRLIKKNIDRVIVPKYLRKRLKECTVCREQMLKSRLNWHLKNHVDPQLLLCPYCDHESYSSLEQLAEHVATVHRALSPLMKICMCCNDVHELDRECTVGHSLALYQCDICDKRTFHDRVSLQKHITRLHKHKKSIKDRMHRVASPINLKKVSCIICHTKVRISHMRTHLRGHNTFQCLLCHKRNLSLQSHHSHKVHHTHTQYQCHLCALHFVSHIRLVTHSLRKHRTPIPLSKHCTRCNIA